MFGIERRRDLDARRDKQLLDVLSRKKSIPALETLISGLGTTSLPDDIRTFAISLDASVFLRLATHDKSADVIDYLKGPHEAGVILPGQSVQEFWNNRYNVVPSLARQLSKSFEDFSKQLDKLDGDFSVFKSKFEEIIEDFQTSHGHIFDEGTVNRTFQMLETLREVAVVPFVNRLQFEGLAAQRQMTKTPPGFRDKPGNNGDFYIWLDTLRGVQTLLRSRNGIKGLVFVTNDTKDDWSRDGTPHPILSAELKAISELDLHIVDLKRFVSLVSNSAT
ncbi:MAG: PIN-like domain-containing protein [Erythrobacter sp.]|uniref:PIN-like domain-containing protein n=1 Tax=Erythrobacter sp. TaxID=1042 RepID=UPI0032678CA1